MHFDSVVLHVINTYTPERLTEILYTKKLLLNGSVLKAHKKVEDITFVSHIVKVELLFSPGASCVISNELVLKISRTDIAHIDNTREMIFYTEIAQHMKNPPTPLFLEASYHEQFKMSCILLVNLNRTHVNLQLNYPLMPSFHHCSRVVARLAAFHAYWWDHPFLEKQSSEHSTNDFLTLYEAFEEHMKEWFHGTMAAIYTKILSNIKLVFEKEDRNTTIIHGDAHLGNVLYPKSEDHDVVFIDWSDWNRGKALDDIAYMIALGFFHDQKKDIELFLIELHNRIINENGIPYNLEDAHKDYKLAVIRCMFIPIFQWSHKLPATIWFYNFERIMASFKALECMELLS